MVRKNSGKKVVVISEGIAQRKRISFKEYAKDKENVELIVDWIFLPVKFKTYGLLLTDGNEEYRISYTVRAEVMDKIFDTFNIRIGKNYEGKILVLKKKGKIVTIEEGDEEARYIWVSGKGWRLEIEEKDDIPF